MQINKKQKLKVVLLLCLTVINMIMVIPNGVALSRGTTKTNETMTINQSIDSNNATLAIPEQWNRFGLQNFEDWYQADVLEYMASDVENVVLEDIEDMKIDGTIVKSRGVKFIDIPQVETILLRLHPVNHSAFSLPNYQLNYSMVIDLSECYEDMSTFSIKPYNIDDYNYARLRPCYDLIQLYNGTEFESSNAGLNYSKPILVSYGIDAINEIIQIKVMNTDKTNYNQITLPFRVSGYLENDECQCQITMTGINVEYINASINAIDSNQVFTFQGSDEMEIDLDYDYTWDRCLQMYQTNLKSFQNSNYEGFMPYMNITDETNEQYVSDVKTSAMDWSQEESEDMNQYGNNSIQFDSDINGWDKTIGENTSINYLNVYSDGINTYKNVVNFTDSGTETAYLTKDNINVNKVSYNINVTGSICLFVLDEDGARIVALSMGANYIQLYSTTWNYYEPIQQNDNENNNFRIDLFNESHYELYINNEKYGVFENYENRITSNYRKIFYCGTISGTSQSYISSVYLGNSSYWAQDNYVPRQALPVYQTINALEIENGYFTKSEFDYWWNPIEGFGYDYTPYAERRTDITFEITQEISDYSEYLINTMFQYSVNWNMSIEFINEDYQEKYIAGLAMSETNITKWTNWNNTFDADVETIEVGVFPDHEIAFGWGVNTIATYEIMQYEIGNGCYEMWDAQEPILEGIDLEGWKIYLNFQDWTCYGNATNPFILKGMETSLPLYNRGLLNFTSQLTPIEEKYGVYEYETKLNHDFTNPVLPSNYDYYFQYIYAMNITYSSFETADNFVDIANVSYSTISVEEEMDENEIHTYNSSQNPVGKDIQYQYMTVIGGYKLYGANETQYTITLNFKLQWVFYYEEAELGFIAKIVGWIAPLILMLIFPVAFLRISNKKYVGLMLTIGLLSGFGVMYVSEMISINYTILLCVITVVMAIILMGVKSNK